MRKKSVAPHQRLAELFQATETRGGIEVGRDTVDEHARLDPALISSETDLNWDNQIIHDAYAGAVLTLYGTPVDEPLAAAFKASGLNPKKPLHWRLLITMFAIAHFEKRRGRGRPPEWSDRRYCRLLQDVDRMKVKHPDYSMSSVFANLSKLSAYKDNKGKKLTAGRIKTAYRAARDPELNGILAAWLNEDIQEIRVKYQSEGLNWSSDTEKRLSEKINEANCAEIARRWRAENPEVI